MGCTSYETGTKVKADRIRVVTDFRGTEKSETVLGSEELTIQSQTEEGWKSKKWGCLWNRRDVCSPETLASSQRAVSSVLSSALCWP